MKREVAEQNRYHSARDAHEMIKAERRQHNARTDVDHRTAKERAMESTYSGKTGSQLVQEAKDRAYWETRGMNTTEFARDSIREVLPESAIMRDYKYLREADYNDLSPEEKRIYLGKMVQLSDIFPTTEMTGGMGTSIAFGNDLATFKATRNDIDASDVALWRKIAADGVNTVSSLGFVPGGFIVDALAYEIMDRLLRTKNQGKQK